MSSESLRILVISYFFPPFNRVGGRRWAKHCKYFEKENIKFNVLAGDFTGSSPWDEDIKSYRERISRIELVKPKTPYFKKKLPDNILQKIIWKASLIFWQFKKKMLKGNYNDTSLGNKNSFYNQAKSIIARENINTVILSCGPFTYSSILPILKSNFPHLKYVLDYRDYWEDGFIGLTNKQISNEIKNQLEVVNSVDLILSPNLEMQKHYAETFDKPSYLLPHCIDQDNLKNLPKKTPTKGIQLIYGGAFYDQIGENIALIKKFIDQFNRFQKTTADFYVSVKGYEKELAHPSLNRFDFIESSLYFEKVIQADYVILILPPNRVNAMSSKFFELIALRKPILYFGKEGMVSEFIVRNKLGFHITLNNLEEQIKEIIDNLNTARIPDPSYDISTHTFEYHTKFLIKKLESL